MIADLTIAALVQADAQLAADYARCQAKHRAAVEAYELVRTTTGAKPPN